MPRPKLPPFDYTLDYKKLNLRKHPHLYRIGKGEQGVLMVEPYRSELLPLWRFRTPQIARESSKLLFAKFADYKKKKDFVGMDMARKFLQMGYTRSRRYANHHSGKKYDASGIEKPLEPDPIKAESAEIFKKVWKKAESDKTYQALKQKHLESTSAAMSAATSVR